MVHAELYRIDTINPANHNGVVRRCIGQHGVIIAAAAVAAAAVAPLTK